MKITLIVPPEGYTTRMGTHTLGLTYIAGVLEAGGHSVEIIDSIIEKLSWNGFENKIKKSNADVFGITCDTNSRFKVFKAARKIKELLDVPVILGGPHVTFTDVDTLSCINDVDIVVRGEGEYTMLELVNALEKGENLRDVKGISYRENGQIVKNPAREPVKDLDSLPFPARHLLPLKKYNEKLEVIERIKCAGVIFSRGCPNRCTFCSESAFWGKPFRLASPKRAVDEIEFLINEYGYNAFDFWDSTFNLLPKWSMQICDEILKRKLDIKWYCRIRADRANRELLEKMKASGCIALGVGVESGSPRILKSIKKSITIDQVKDLAKLAMELDFHTKFFFMYNLPRETLNDIKMTFNLMRELESYGNKIQAPIAHTQIYPGTEIEIIAKNMGILPLNFSWSEPYYNLKNKLIGENPEIPLFEQIKSPVLLRLRYSNDIRTVMKTLKTLQSLEDFKVFMRRAYTYLKKRFGY